MDSLLVLEKIVGVMGLLLGLSLMNKKHIMSVMDNLEKNEAVLWLSGFMAAIIGLVVLSISHRWSMHLDVLLTILGWAALIKGALIMLFPFSTWHSVYRKYKSSGWNNISGVIALVLGLVMLFHSFLK